MEQFLGVLMGVILVLTIVALLLFAGSTFVAMNPSPAGWPIVVRLIDAIAFGWVLKLTAQSAVEALQK